MGFVLNLMLCQMGLEPTWNSRISTLPTGLLGMRNTSEKV